MCQINFNCVIIFLLLPLASYALPTDRLQTMRIAADESRFNYKEGINEFTGNVKVDQGTTHLTANRLVTKSNKAHKIQEIIAYGTNNKAHYWTIPKLNEPELHAKANIIKYYPLSSNITLEQSVLVTQGENSFQGQLIHYNSINQTISVPEMKKSRAILVYNPDKA